MKNIFRVVVFLMFLWMIASVLADIFKLYVFGPYCLNMLILQEFCIHTRGGIKNFVELQYIDEVRIERIFCSPVH